MKKLVLTSLLAVFAATGANAAINDNPMYRPDQGRFYSVTELSSNTDTIENWSVSEKFGYGITDRASLYIDTDLYETDSFDHYGWGDFEIGADYRLLDDMNWKVDAYGSYAVGPVWGDRVSIAHGHAVSTGNAGFLEEENTMYTWGVGVRAGYVTDMWTVAGHVEFNYLNSESFNWGDELRANHRLIAGLDGFLSLDSNWALMLGAEYTGVLDDEVENAGLWTGKFGVNYNIDEDMFVGAYISGEMDHSSGDWEIADGMGFGVKFGAQF